MDLKTSDFVCFFLKGASSAVKIRDDVANTGPVKQQIQSVACSIWRFYVTKESYADIKQSW